MNCTKKIQIDDIVYIANVNFRNAIKCNEIATDETIGDLERSLGIIYTMFGEQGLTNPDHYEKLLKWIRDYLSCGKDIEELHNEPDMDYIQDMEYIETSFMSDYKIDLSEINMDWQKFNKLINGLSNSEFGNCCILNRIRNLRNFDVNQITDLKEKSKIIEAKNRVALKKKEKKEIRLTVEQQNSVDQFYKELGF